ncbi:CHASE2 domain-containing protein [Paraburkholderia ginsengisoli]|uniref:CHASE2 domain-containing protein n=1 Tax=Paraburkholderia ginsengisoli TaxID=311231 RepID=A0A7T4TC81_9BURK|nr:CHASE2 domain-containing protein [Paraburkholderia ginsengisoli]QQC67250.1 CHASE2 domain-containing protein [Paraburkholderia ginsengisoli]
MKRYYDLWLARIKPLLKTAQGRPVALAVLFALSLLNLSSEWPSNLARPAFVTTLDDTLPDSFKSARQLLFDQYQRHHPRVPTAQPVTIVEIDEETLASVGQWPWPRNRLAALIDAIAASKPLAIGLDLYMPEPDQTSPDKVADNLPETASTAALAAGLRALPSHDAILAGSLRAAPTILGAAALDHAAFATSIMLRSAPILVHGADPLPRVLRYDYVLASLPQLQAAAHGQAMLSVALEQGVVRHIPLIMGLRDELVPSLPMEMLRVATGSAALEVLTDAAGVQAVGVADVQVPTQPGGDIWLHFASIRSTLGRYVSARDVLQGKVDPDRFHDKLVLVGLTGAGVTDMRTTPLGELVPGIEIQAQVIETIVEGRFLRRPTWLKWVESAFIMGVGLLIIWYVPRRQSRLAVLIRAVPKGATVIGLLLHLLNLLCCFYIFVRFGLLVDAAAIFIILSAVMGCFLSPALLHQQEQNRLEAVRAQARQADQDSTGKAPEA